MRMTRRDLIRAAAVAGLAAAAPGLAVRRTIKIRMSDNGDFLVPLLAQSLGYLQSEGLEIERVKAGKFSGHDYLIQKPMNEGKFDFAYHWFHHTVFGARHGLPVQAIMVLNDAPGAKVMVARDRASEIRSAVDFRGRSIAQGFGYSTKSIVTNYLAHRAGLPKDSYTPFHSMLEGREEAVVQGLVDGVVDVATFMEPMTSVVERTGKVVTLYDLTSAASTKKIFGARFPAQSILTAPTYAKKNPETVQRLVNAMVRTMRFINSHDAEEIAEALPLEYFAGKDRSAAKDLIARTHSTFAHGDYSIGMDDAQLILDSIEAAEFDSTVEGQWRAGGAFREVDVSTLYDNRFAVAAMTSIR